MSEALVRSLEMSPLAPFHQRAKDPLLGMGLLRHNICLYCADVPSSDSRGAQSDRLYFVIYRFHNIVDKCFLPVKIVLIDLVPN